MPRGGKVEQFNQHFQRNFYRLMRLKRGSFAQIELQAEDHQQPGEQVHEAVAGGRGAKARQRDRGKVQLPQVGDKCRVLVKQEHPPHA